MTVSIRRLVGAVVLGLCVVGAAANVAQASARLDHACCHGSPARSSAASDVPCHGFLPLTCCRTAALPGGDHGAAPQPAGFVPYATAILAPARVAATPPALAALAPRIAATRLSVVLLV